MGFVFYDTETTGTETSFDQILQFAAIYTDNDLNELECLEIRCRLLPHVVPAPGAMRVTGVTVSQLLDPALPSHYEMIHLVREKFLEWSPALFIGYNSLEYDEHLLRQAFFKTLRPPYLTNMQGNGRSDVLRMVQAASLFAPDAIVIPSLGGRPSFKLDRVAPANGFNHENAHDALADVRATIHLCRLLIEQAPDIWSAFMRFSQKAAVIDHVNSEEVFCLADFYFGKPYAWLVTAIGANPENPGDLYVYDLQVDPETLVGISDDALVARLKRSPKPIRRVRSNGSPMIAAIEDAPEIAEALSLGFEEVSRRAAFLRDNTEFKERLLASFQATREEKEPSPYVEEQIYDGFIEGQDAQLMEQFHTLPWEQRLAVLDRFADERLKISARNLIHAERPDILDENVRLELDRLRARRVLGLDGDVPWLTLPKAIEQADDLLSAADSDEADRVLLGEHKAYLITLLEEATALL